MQVSAALRARRTVFRCGAVAVELASACRRGPMSMPIVSQQLAYVYMWSVLSLQALHALLNAAPVLLARSTCVH